MLAKESRISASSRKAEYVCESGLRLVASIFGKTVLVEVVRVGEQASGAIAPLAYVRRSSKVGVSRGS